MTTSQDIKPKIKELIMESKGLYLMNREQIFTFLSEVAATSDELADYSCDIAKKMSQVEKEVLAENTSSGSSKAGITAEIKRRNADYTAEKEWAKNQLALLNSLRIAALAAQRSSE